ncbi:MAG: adenine deaminase [Bacteroidetes bacterium]|nr:adenine deaminase [Bacteroidota bacterium]
MSSFQIKGNIVNIPNRSIQYGTIEVSEGKIYKIREEGEAQKGADYILPGFVDSHVHIESSMLVPAEFARLAVVHGTVATISDPHEIANVCGLAGVEYMIDNGKTVPFKFHFGAPSCVPATIFETAGANLNAKDVELLLKKEDIYYLSEVMNFPGVLNEDPDLMAKIAAAKACNKPVDGHAPGLRGKDAARYISAGISTDHECFTKEEALDKLQHGMKIIIREGSAAKNFDALIDLLHDHENAIMFCSDDKHPDSLVAGHINQLCARAVAKGIDVFKVLKAACINPVLHYGMRNGLLRMNDAADFIIVSDLNSFKVKQTYIDGVCVAENGKTKMGTGCRMLINQFDCSQKTEQDFIYPLQKWGEEENFEQVLVIEARDGQLITGKLLEPITSFSVNNNALHSNIEKDLLKMVVVNRYKDAPVAKTFVKHFGLKKGAIASSVAHDSHNIIAVGVDAESICYAINKLIEEKGGICACYRNENEWTEAVLPLPIAGLMSTEDGYTVAQTYSKLDAMAKQMGSTLSAPFMTLSFMALLVIPDLKLSDLGLFDGQRFRLL